VEPRISLVTLGVQDLAKSVAFYRDVVGWSPSPSPPDIAFFDLNGVILALYPQKELVADFGGEEDAGAVPSGSALAHNARSRDEVDAIFEGLRERGATIVKEPQEVFWGGYSGYFEDPDGHKWEVAHNPFWTVMADGRISMEAPE